MSTTIFVDGQEGTTGLRIHEMLAARGDVRVLSIDPDKRKDPAARRALLNAADVVFLCLPDAAARESVALVDNQDTVVIDASTAFRTHPDWAYGLPELAPSYRAKIRAGKRIAVPGCHATAFLAPVAPLVRAGLIPADARLHAFSITGYSGGGKKMIAEYQVGGERLASPRAYALGLTHKHLPEMRAHAGLAHSPTFVPVVGPFYKGLYVTTYIDVRESGQTPAALHDALSAHYAGEPFIRVMPLGDAGNLDDGFFDAQACNDTNRVDIFVFGDDERIVLIGREDNLGKGASGAAIQCLNIALGVDETAGLAADAVSAPA
jgi:N-acetyl-gamma-glutamyl-phosphate reductase